MISKKKNKKKTTCIFINVLSW